MARYKRHMCISVKGMMAQPEKKLNGLFEDEHGNRKSGKWAKEYLKLCLFEGKRVIPMSGEPCEGFSYEDGCPGHLISEED